MALHVYQCSILLPIDMIWNDIAMNTYTYEKESNTNSSCMFTNVFMVKHQNASQKTWSSTILDILKTVKRSALLLTSHAWLFLTPTKRLETIHSSMQLLSFGTNALEPTLWNQLPCDVRSSVFFSLQAVSLNVFVSPLRASFVLFSTYVILFFLWGAVLIIERHRNVYFYYYYTCTCFLILCWYYRVTV